MIAKALTMLGEYSPALKHLRLAKLLHPGPNLSILGGIAHVYALMGMRDRATRLLTRIAARAAGQHASLINVHLALGDKQRALASLEGACAGHEWYVAGLKWDCSLDALRTDARFRTILSRIGV